MGAVSRGGVTATAKSVVYLACNINKRGVPAAYTKSPVRRAFSAFDVRLDDPDIASSYERRSGRVLICNAGVCLDEHGYVGLLRVRGGQHRFVVSTVARLLGSAFGVRPTQTF